MSEFVPPSEDELSFYINSELYIQMNGGWYYDTYSSYGFAVYNLKKINEEIKKGKILIIENNIENITIESTKEFHDWVKTKFNSFNNDGFEKYLDKPFN